MRPKNQRQQGGKKQIRRNSGCTILCSLILSWMVCATAGTVWIVFDSLQTIKLSYSWTGPVGHTVSPINSTNPIRCGYRDIVITCPTDSQDANYAQKSDICFILNGGTDNTIMMGAWTDITYNRKDVNPKYNTSNGDLYEGFTSSGLIITWVIISIICIIVRFRCNAKDRCGLSLKLKCFVLSFIAIGCNVVGTLMGHKAMKGDQDCSVGLNEYIMEEMGDYAYEFTLQEPITKWGMTYVAGLVNIGCTCCVFILCVVGIMIKPKEYAPKRQNKKKEVVVSVNQNPKGGNYVILIEGQNDVNAVGKCGSINDVNVTPNVSNIVINSSAEGALN